MSTARQTAIHVPACAVAALERYRTEHGFSRDGAVRHVLAHHVEQQHALSDADRITHVSTVLRHPLRPVHPGLGPDPRVRLSMRLSDELVVAAKEVGLVLPGQCVKGGNSDYRARTLTDSVMAAIAAVEPMTDDVLAGLRPCIRHQAAIGLWRLAVAATLTREEQWELLDARDRGDEPGRRVLEMLREEDSAWHDQFRTQVVRFLAPTFLVDDYYDGEEDDGEKLLYDQYDGSAWAELRDAFERRGLADEYFDKFTGWSLNLEGRGASLLWRTHRKVELEDLGKWLAAGPERPRTMTVGSTGWELQLPEGWIPAPLKGRHALVNSSEVLALQAINPEREFIWPIGQTKAGTDAPIPGIASVIAAVNARRVRGRRTTRTRMPPIEIAELLLIQHDAILLDMPVHVAHTAGLLDTAELDRIVTASRTATTTNMQDLIAAMCRRLTAAPTTEDEDSDNILAFLRLQPRPAPEQVRAALEAALQDPTEFRRAALDAEVPDDLLDQFDAMEVLPVHPIVVDSLAQVLVEGVPEPALTWICRQLLRSYRSTLAEERMAAWQRGLDHKRDRPQWRGTDTRRSR